MTVSLLQISWWIQQWKNFENPSTSAKVAGKSIEVPFLTHSVVTVIAMTMLGQRNTRLGASNRQTNTWAFCYTFILILSLLSRTKISSNEFLSNCSQKNINSKYFKFVQIFWIVIFLRTFAVNFVQSYLTRLWKKEKDVLLFECSVVSLVTVFHLFHSFTKIHVKSEPWCHNYG